MISVLMSIYKGDNPLFLDEALKSVMMQSRPADEVVLVQDGPLLEEQIEVLKKHADKTFKIIAFESNRGLALALREGLEQCSHPYVVRMDSDDISHQDRFKEQRAFLEEHQDIDVVGSSIQEFNVEIDDLMAVRQPPEKHSVLESYAKRRSPVNHASVMYKKDAVLSAGNYQNFLWNEDYHLWSRMLMNGSKFANMKRSLLYVRGGSDMYKRRGGFRYALQDIRLQMFFLRIGFLGPLLAVTNICVRVPVRIFPNKLRSWFYESFLRDKPKVAGR